MSSRAGGKLKPLKVISFLTQVRRSSFSTMQAPKKEKKEETEEEKAFKEKQKQNDAALKAARDKGER